MFNYIGVQVKVSSLLPKVCEISKFMSVCIMIFYLEGQGLILFPLIDYVGAHVKMHYNQRFARDHGLSVFAV